MRLKFPALAAGLAMAVAAVPVAAAEVSGAGATFPDLIYAKWIEAYRAETDVALSYQSIGSGGGIKQIETRNVTFGATDKPLDARELDEHGLVQFPTLWAASFRSSMSPVSSWANWCSTVRRLPRYFSARSPGGTIRRSSSSIRP